MGQASNHITIDGAFGEGGGQVIRTSVSLAAITGAQVEIVNIRARRSKPGLQAQHLTSVRAAAALCQAEVYGAELGSLRLLFRPGAPVEESSFEFDVAAARGGASAGATGLVAQTALAPMQRLGRPTRMTIKGGTHVPMAPPADYIRHVYLPALRRMGADAELRCESAGFFPRGGGEIAIEASGAAACNPVDFVHRGRLRALRVCVVTSQLPGHVAERGLAAARKELVGYGVDVVPEIRDLASAGSGAAIVVVAECENGLGGWTALGERGKPMERVVLEAVRGFQRWHAGSAAVDEHLSDQLVLPCALIPATSRWTTPAVTDHLHTVLWVVSQFLPITYKIEDRPDGSSEVVLEGVSDRA